MTWSKFDDRARKHPKCRRAGNLATMLWRCAIDFSNEHHTDGFIPTSELAKLMPEDVAEENALELARRLVEASLRPGGAGLFEVEDGGFQVHDFLDWNESAADYEDRKRAEREKKRTQRKGRPGGTSAGTRGHGSVPEGHDHVPRSVPGSVPEGHANKRTLSSLSPDLSPGLSPRARALGRDGILDPSEIQNGEEAAESKEAAEGDTPRETAREFFVRVWDPLWAEQYGGDCYPWPVTFRANDEHTRARELGELARRDGGVDPERLLRHKIKSYLRDDGDRSFPIAERRHPVSMFASRWVSYGSAKPKVARVVDPPRVRRDPKEVAAFLDKLAKSTIHPLGTATRPEEPDAGAAVQS